MYIEDLFPNINLESYNIEFKGIIKTGKNNKNEIEEVKWLKTIVAFANTDGGQLYIGVEDHSHKILALDQATTDRTIRMIHSQIKSKINPAIVYHISTTKIPNISPSRYIICIEVKKSEHLPVMLHAGNGLVGVFIRNFGESDPATSEQIRDMIYASEQVPFDQPFTDMQFKKMNFSKLFNLASQRNLNITEKKLISIGFMDKEHYLARGSLFFKDDCSTPKTKVVANVWEGMDKGSEIVLAHQVYDGNLLDVISKSLDFIYNHTINGFKKEATSRVDYFSYPQRSITEGIVNAVGHRNYYIEGSQIEINIFKDRLEITSPGSLLGGRVLFKEKNIASITPRRRNEVICHILEMVHYMEESGSGFDKIELDYAQADEYHKPYISCDASSFTLVLPDLLYKEGINNDSVRPGIFTNKEAAGKHDMAILSYCYNQEHSVREIAAYLGINDSSYFRKYTISRLVESDLLTEKKIGRTNYYSTNQSNVFLR